jgi:hypothetical protein
VVGRKRLEKSETGAGIWTRSHACCYAGPLPLLEGAENEFSTEDPLRLGPWIGRFGSANPFIRAGMSCP